MCLMIRDKIQGFMFGLSAGFLFAHLLKPRDDVSPSRNDQGRDADTGSNDGPQSVLRTVATLGNRKLAAVPGKR